MKRSQDEELDVESSEEDPVYEQDGMLDYGGFPSGETSLATTRTSTPYGSQSTLPCQEKNVTRELHARSEQLANSMAAMSLAPVTPHEAEVQVKRACAATFPTSRNRSTAKEGPHPPSCASVEEDSISCCASEEDAHHVVG